MAIQAQLLQLECAQYQLQLLEKLHSTSAGAALLQYRSLQLTQLAIQLRQQLQLIPLVL